VRTRLCRSPFKRCGNSTFKVRGNGGGRQAEGKEGTEQNSSEEFRTDQNKPDQTRPNSSRAEQNTTEQRDRDPSFISFSCLALPVPAFFA
jgi:hypothetical protein